MMFSLRRQALHALGALEVLVRQIGSDGYAQRDAYDGCRAARAAVYRANWGELIPHLAELLLTARVLDASLRMTRGHGAPQLVTAAANLSLAGRWLLCGDVELAARALADAAKPAERAVWWCELCWLDCAGDACVAGARGVRPGEER